MDRYYGRRGLPRETVDAALRLLARESTHGERLSDDVIARRVGCSRESVRQLRRGEHRAQQDEDRRGAPPARIRLALELLSAEPRPTFTRVARLLAMNRRLVRALARGEHITQRG